jgi:hypothetical protein
MRFFLPIQQNPAVPACFEELQAAEQALKGEKPDPSGKAKRKK